MSEQPQEEKEKILVIDDGTWQCKTLQKELEKNATTEAQPITVHEGASIKDILEAVPKPAEGEGEKGKGQKLFLYYSSDQLLGDPESPDTMIDEYNKLRDQYPHVTVNFVYQNANDVYIKNLGKFHGTYVEDSEDVEVKDESKTETTENQ